MSYLENISYPLKRYAIHKVVEALEVFRVVVILGARQSGKTTLCRSIAEQFRMKFYSMDDHHWRSAAESDPNHFLADVNRAVIDEIQNASGLMSAMRLAVDEDPRKGRFLITGSVDLLSGTLTPNDDVKMGGRVASVRLFPLSQGEIFGVDVACNFLDVALKKGVFTHFDKVGKTSFLYERLSVGGYSESVLSYEKGLHTQWLKSHYGSIIEGDVRSSLVKGKFVDLEKLIGLVAEGSGRLLNYSDWASALSVDVATLKYWLKVLERIFLIKIIPHYSDKRSRQLAKGAKIHFLDSGLRLAVLGKTEEEMFADRRNLGSFLESFIYSEVLKLAQYSQESINIFHYRSHDKIEVDIILEGGGKLVAIEVKSSKKVSSSDFRGLRHMQKISGDRFSCGILFHDGDTIENYGPSLYAMPFHVLWSAPEEIFPKADSS